MFWRLAKYAIPTAFVCGIAPYLIGANGKASVPDLTAQRITTDTGLEVVIPNGNFTPPKPRNQCEAAAQAVTKDNRALWLAMESITRNETGSTPQPWAVMLNGLNVGDAPHCRSSQYGRSCIFSSKEEAETAVNGLLAIGYDNIDVGCFQVNMKWHGGKFNGDPFGPEENARVAASIFKDCFAKTKDFQAALGCYHSPGTPAKANAYAARAMGHLRAVLNQQLTELEK